MTEEHKPRVLVVDDEEMNRNLLSRRLVRRGFEVLLAEGGQDALIQIEEEPLDLVLLDIMMPEMSGIEVLHEVRRRWSMGALPVIMVSARDQSEDVVEALSLGANDYLTKPLDFTVALARIHTQILRKHAEEHDRLTGLPGPRLFGRAVERAFKAHQRGGAPFGVVAIGHERLSQIRNALGAEAADALLRQIWHNTRSGVRLGDALGRHGEDTFTVLLENVLSSGMLKRICHRLGQQVGSPVDIEGRQVAAAVALGAVLVNERHKGPAELVEEALAGLEQARRCPPGRIVIFDAERRADACDRLALEQDLREAIARDALTVHYQPIVGLGSSLIAGFEALVRWNHPTRGPISPEVFVPLAEETGLIHGLGQSVLGAACRSAARWMRKTQRPFFMSVNVSGAQLADEDLVARILATVEHSGLPPEHLKLEITETFLMQNMEEAITAMEALRARGIRLSIDDFGTGHASLAWLYRFPVDVLKIDRSFISGMGRNPESLQIVKMIHALGHALGMEVIAEGVETVDDVMVLSELGCDFGQGYYFSRPLPPEAALAALEMISIAQATPAPSPL